MHIDANCLEKFAVILVGASVAGVAASGVSLPNGVIESLVGGFGLWAKARYDARADADRVVRRLTTELQRERQGWGALSTHASEGIRANAPASFLRVIPLCALLPEEVVGQRLSPEPIAELFLQKAAKALPSVYANPDPGNPETHLPRQFLLRLTTRAYANLVEEPDYIAQIAPALWQATLEGLARIEAKIDLLVEQLYDTTRQLGLKEGTVIGIAKVFATDVDDFDTALRELTRAVGIAARIEREGRVPFNTGDPVSAVMAEVTGLNREQNFAAAADVFEDAFDRIASDRACVIEAGQEQTILSRNVAGAARHALRSRPRQGAGLRPTRLRRPRGSQPRHDHTPHQRGMALNDRGTALQTLGERDPDAARLTQAVEVFHAAMQERTRDCSAHLGQFVGPHGHGDG